ncbi:MAG: hypothetical protein QNJ97_08895 [Myxococcota bacterium]|nr:hypothetical protein [Myxococcota bacterium]
MNRNFYLTPLLCVFLVWVLLCAGCDEQSLYDPEGDIDTDRALDDDSDTAEDLKNITPSCVRYVDPEIAEPGDARSWEGAAQTVEAALERLPLETDPRECEIWVKGENVSVPNGTAAKIVEGFSGSEVSRSPLKRVALKEDSHPRRFTIRASRKHPDDTSKKANVPEQFEAHALPSLQRATSGDFTSLKVGQSHGATYFNYNNTGYNYLTMGSNDKTYFRTYNGSGGYAYKMTLLANGNLGIGTTSPASKLDVRGSLRANYNNNTTSYLGRTALGYISGFSDYAGLAHLDNNNTTEYALIQYHDGSTFLNSAYNKHLRLRINNQTKLMVYRNGNIGIGTGDAAPGAKLEVAGGGIWVNRGATGTSIVGRTVFDSDMDWWSIGHEDLDIDTQYALRQSNLGSTSLNGTSLHLRAGGINQVAVYQNMITVLADNANFMGDISTKKLTAEEIVVEGGTADYVFDDDYHLMSLENVEAYIKENHHLPNIPNQEEVSASGKNIGETQTRLLEKIEELTLHLIAQNKRIKALESKNSSCGQ